MADYDITLAPVKRSSFDVGRKMKFWTTAAGTTGAVVKNLTGDTLEAGGDSHPAAIKVPADGHLGLRFSQWPVYYSDNRGWTRVKQVPGMPATITGLSAATHLTSLGTGGDIAANLAEDYADDGTAKDLDTDAKRIAAANATNAKVNLMATRLKAATDKIDALIVKLETAGVIASS